MLYNVYSLILLDKNESVYTAFTYNFFNTEKRRLNTMYYPR
jgi:hypothetical protein